MLQFKSNIYLSNSYLFISAFTFIEQENDVSRDVSKWNISDQWAGSGSASTMISMRLMNTEESVMLYTEPEFAWMNIVTPFLRPGLSLVTLLEKFLSVMLS